MEHVVDPPREWVRAHWRSYALAVGLSLCAAALFAFAALVLAGVVIFGSTPTFSVAYDVHFGFWPGSLAPVARVELRTGFRRTLIDMQEYSAVLELTMPETQRNLRLGTFSVAGTFYGQSGAELFSSVFSVRVLCNLPFAATLMELPSLPPFADGNASSLLGCTDL